MTEQELIQGCIEQDRRSQKELYKRYFPLMSSIALRYTNNQEEAIQQMNLGFFKVLNSLEKFNDQYALATWIRNILVNHLIDEFRKNKKHITNIHITDFQEYDFGISLNEGALKFEEQELRALLKTLPEVTQKVFNMYAIDGFKHTEIGTLLGISNGTSKWHVSEARKRLKVQIERHYGEVKKRLKLDYEQDRRHF
jgi:RNA polymerase sigma factor (sigma-70 family)